MSWVYREMGPDGDRLGMYQCEELNQAGLIQAFSTKSAGNMALHTGDNPQEVVEHRRIFLKYLGLDVSQITAAQQTHGVNVQAVDKAQVGKGAQNAGDAFPETDALLTKEPGIVLTIYTADCLPIYIYDPVTPAVGIIHAGWRGAIAGIVTLTLAKMSAVFGTNPVRCWVAIGPGIGPECFRVSADVADRFRESYPEVVLENQNQFGVALTAFNKRLLLKAGVPPQQIIASDLCTCCRPDIFFSYRAARAGNAAADCSGRMIGLIALQ